MGRTAVPEAPGPHGGIQRGSAGLPAAARTFAQGERNPLGWKLRRAKDSARKNAEPAADGTQTCQKEAEARPLTADAQTFSL